MITYEEALEFIAHTHVFPHSKCDVCKPALAYWKTVTHPKRISFERAAIDPNEVSREQETDAAERSYGH